MPHLAEDRYALVRRLYEESELTIAEIAILADVSESAIYQRSRREQWRSARRPGVTPRRAKLRPPLPPTTALKALAGAHDSGAEGGGNAGAGAVGAGAEGGAAARGLPDVDRAETARRLWLAVDRHLADLETHGAPDGMIRAAQNLATLARTLETLIDVERGLAQERRDEDEDEGPDDIDEFRNEIARRLEGLYGARTGCKPPGAPDEPGPEDQG